MSEIVLTVGDLSVSLGAALLAFAALVAVGLFTIAILLVRGSRRHLGRLSVYRLAGASWYGGGGGLERLAM